MKVSGYITDSYGNTEGATIQLYRDGEGTTLGVASNQDGYFEIDNDDIKPNDEFKISFIGLKPQIKKASELQEAEIFLSEGIEQLDEVVITASIGKKPKIKKENTKKIEEKWYLNPLFLISTLTLVTTGTIIYIIKKTR
jgi:hypothetical protein